MDTALGLGWAVLFVLTLTTPINWILHHFFLKRGALSWAGLPNSDLEFLSLIVSIAVIAATVQWVEMMLDHFFPRLYNALGIYLPLIAVNCAILGTSLFMIERDYGFLEGVVFGIGSGFGWAFAIAGMAAIRVRLRYADPPEGLRGTGILFITTGLMALAFMGFLGIR
jgi:Na+-transporting NADH:ubiquinone oxidoreductase subunit E